MRRLTRGLDWSQAVIQAGSPGSSELGGSCGCSEADVPTKAGPSQQWVAGTLGAEAPFPAVDWSKAVVRSRRPLEPTVQAGTSHWRNETHGACAKCGGASTRPRSDSRSSLASFVAAPAAEANERAVHSGHQSGVTLCDDDVGYCLRWGDHEDVCYRCTCYSAVNPENALRREEVVTLDDYPPGDYWKRAEADGAAVNGVEVDLASADDPANVEHEDVWFTTPPDLADFWSTAFPFSDPTMSWVYAHVGSNADIHCQSIFEPYLPYLMEGGYLVCGLMPYAAYQVISRSRSALYSTYRVRLWTGLMHHFSFFLPPPAYWDHSSRWGTATFLNYVDSAGNDAWNEPAGRVDAKGRFVDMFTSLTERVTFGVFYDAGGSAGEDSFLNVYSCDPTENYVASGSWPGTTYQAVDGFGNLLGTTNRNCFSDPFAYDTGTRMTSFLGTSVEGEVCIFANDGHFVPSGLQLARKAFEILFGEAVTVSFELKGQGFSASAPAFTVNRWFRLTANDLVPAAALIAQVNALRTTPEGRYLFRDYDLSRLQAAASAPPPDDTECACTEE